MNTVIDHRDGRKAWSIAFLLFLSQMINYFDKSVMGLAAPAIMSELGLTPEQYGLVASSFFSLYAVSGVAVGLFVAHRVPAKPLLIILVLIWSLAQLPIILFPSLGVLVACRVVLGIGEGPASPTATSAAHDWFSSENRNMPTALLMLGSSLGSVIAGPALSQAMIAYGWRGGFVLCAMLGISWVVLWSLFGASAPRAAPALDPSLPQRRAPAPKGLWTDPTILASMVVGFCSYWVVGFVVAWMAPFIRLGLGYDAAATGWIVGAVSGVGSVSLLAISYLSQRLLKCGVRSRIARGGVNAACLLISAAAFAGAGLLVAPEAKLVLLAIAAALPTLTFTLGPAMVSELAPDAQRSRLLITIYAGITLAGFVSPLVAGHLIGNRGLAGYDMAILVNAGVVLLAGIVALVFLDPERSRARFA